ncbi:RNAse III [Roseivirga pacifica]|uniref:Ribonuclease 3 n=1 Tax=Roseivirga pacifica TaxID=1267423 RepID=A0A1I0RC61_9BACT|nr:ribonuclease III [Roseivirga pacifica]RKQ49374.1 RNAse III [Roseivirga pacifica]SEW38423.1 RNAse III [Roseivirga pacifica]
MFFSRIRSIFTTYSKEDKRLIASIKMMVGSKPLNLRPYRVAVQHTSVAKSVKKGFKESNERLEYLGDAVLGMVVAEYLFKKYPFKDEGFLTEVRSRIVSRDSLNRVARAIGIPDIVKFDRRRKTPNSHKSLYGNTLEAMVGAILIDRGYNFARKFVLKKLLVPHYDIDEILATTKNYKSKLIEWTQKHAKTPKFEHLQTIDKGHFKEFIMQVTVDEEPIAKGHGLSKKKAEQDAAREACIKLEIE